MRIFPCRAHHQSRGGAPVRSTLQRDDGFTLFEVLIAAVVLVIGLVALFGLLDTSLKATAATRAREGATNLARQVLEDARTIPFADLSPGSIVGQLQAMNGLANASSGPEWQVVQRGITYTVAVKECSIDDPKDGYGKHVNALGENPFCKDPGEKEWASGEAIDGTPEDLKRITVDVKWAAIGRSPDVHQVETLSSAGEAPGLNASGLHLEIPTVAVPTQPVITEASTATLTFAVSSPPGTTAMRWSLEGITQTPAPVLQSGTTWTFSWSIPYPAVSDGTYEVSAQAIDATGVEGPPVSIPVKLIRGVPASVTGLKGGFNEVYVSGVKKRVVEMQWRANTERNVIGYRIRNSKKELVCPETEATLSTALSCIQFENLPPLISPGTYSAVALYRDAGGVVQEGKPGTLALVGGPPPAPNGPTELKLEKNAEGAVVLNWTKPAEGGEPVIFYRIYRGSADYTSRYEVSTTTKLLDADAPTEHCYRVTAVDANLTESTPPVGPVCG
jgi:prepilin-type N-terminal cleavage/methylation domain-containing protein